jgi:hypothetical protein
MSPLFLRGCKTLANAFDVLTFLTFQRLSHFWLRLARVVGTSSFWVDGSKRLASDDVGVRAFGCAAAMMASATVSNVRCVPSVADALGRGRWRSLRGGRVIAVL